MRPFLVRTTLALTLSASSLAGPAAPAAKAQGETGGIRLVLVSQPVWYSPEDALGVRLRVENQTSLALDGFQIVAGVNGRVQTRSDLEQSFEATPGFEATRFPFGFKDKVPAFSKTTVSLDEPISSFPTLAGATEGGVYPASFSLLDPTGTTILSSVSTPFIFFPSKPETPLGVVSVLPLNDTPARAPDGSFRVSEEGTFPLGKALEKGGWLDGWTRALRKATKPSRAPDREREKRGRRTPPVEPGPPPLKITVAPTGRLIEEIADLVDGYRLSDGSPASRMVSRSAARSIARLRSLLNERSEVQGILTPYSFTDIPTLIENLGTQDTQEQLLESRSVIQDVLGANLDGEWLFPPAGRLDETSLEGLQLAGYASKSFFSGNTVETPQDPSLAGCPVATLSFACPISVETIHGSSGGFLADEGLNDQLSLLQEEGGDRLALQRLFATTAQIYAELPGEAGRVVQVTIPSQWRPAPHLSRLFLTGLRGAPWLKTLTAEDGLDQGKAVARDIVEVAPRIENAPETAFYEVIEDARETVDSFATAIDPDSDRLRRLRRNVLVAQSRAWWRAPEEGLVYAEEARAEVSELLDQISLGGVQDLTLTSREGQLQLVLINDGVQPMKVQIRFITPNLILDDETIEDRFEPGSTPLNIEAIARTSGTFPVKVVVETTDGRYRIVEKEIVVRSTSLNQIALGLTIGAFVFLVLFYVLRAIRGKRRAEEPAEAPPS